MTPQILAKIQKEQRPWVKHNFGDRPDWQPLMGICEEIGEFIEAACRRDFSAMHDGFADVVIFMCDFCSAMNWEIQEIWETRRHALTGIDITNDFGKREHARALLISIGKAQHHFLKSNQGIRGHQHKHEEMIKDALGCVLKHLQIIIFTDDNECLRNVHSTWLEVKQRDWKKSPKTGV